MADTDLNGNGTERNRTPEQGWFTGDGHAMVSHVRPASASVKTFGGQVSKATMAIERYDLLFMYADISRRMVTGSSIGGTVGHENVFSSFNQMPMDIPVAFVGVATTACHQDTGLNQVSSFMMFGSATVDGNTDENIHAYEAVGWRKPTRGVADAFMSKDRARGILRAELYPIPLDMTRESQQQIITVLRKHTTVVTDTIRQKVAATEPVGGDQDGFLKVVMSDLLATDPASCVYLQYALLEKGTSLDLKVLVHGINVDLWQVLETMWANGPYSGGDQTNIRDQDAIEYAVLFSLAANRMISYALMAGKEMEAIGADPLNNDSIVLRCLEAEVARAEIFFAMQRFVHLLYKTRHEKLYNVVGMCLNECTAGQECGLDLLVRRYVI
jgi:hypothetical protein